MFRVEYSTLSCCAAEISLCDITIHVFVQEVLMLTIPFHKKKGVRCSAKQLECSVPLVPQCKLFCGIVGSSCGGSPTRGCFECQ